MNGRKLFEFRHRGRIIGITRTGRGHYKRYLGEINRETCAVGTAKGDLLRRLILLAPHYPITDQHIVVQRRRRGGGRPRAVALHNASR